MVRPHVSLSSAVLLCIRHTTYPLCHRGVLVTAVEVSDFSLTLAVAQSSVRAARAIIGHIYYYICIYYIHI